MLLNKGPVPSSMGLNPQATQQFGQTVNNFATNPSTWAKGLRRIGLPLSLLLQTNEAHAAELPGFQDKLQQQGLLTAPHEQQHSQPNTMQHEQQQVMPQQPTMQHEEQQAIMRLLQGQI